MEPPAPEAPTRAVQARSEATRRRVLHATVASLARRGLAATSTLQIQADAGVSRGRLLHHFPSRRQLLVAAVQHLAKERFAALRAEPLQLEGEARVRRAIDLLWSIHEDDLFWAAIELWMGARTDDDLKAVLDVEERRLGRVARGLCDDLFGSELAARPGYTDARDLLMTGMRGAALTYAFDERPMAQDPHLEGWYRLMCHQLGLTPVDAGEAARAR